MKLMKKLIAFAIIAGFVACGGANPGSNNEAKTGSLEVNIQEEMSKLFIPALDMATDHYRITIVGPRPSGPDNTRTREVVNSTPEVPPTGQLFTNLYYGRWTVTVQAHNADTVSDGQGGIGTVIGQGVNTVVVNPWADGIADTHGSLPIPQVTVTVIPIPGTGTLYVDVLWNGDVTVDPYLTATLTPLSGSGQALNVVTSGTSGVISSAAPLANGYYTLAVELRERGVSNETQLVAGAAEIVRIVTGQNTTGVIDWGSSINPHFGDFIVNINPQMREPIYLTVTGAELLIAQNDSMDLTVSVDQAATTPDVPGLPGSVTYFWYENGVYQSSGNTITLTADPLVEYLMIDQYYRVDVVCYTNDGLRAGDSSFTYTVTESLTPYRTITSFSIPGALDTVIVSGPETGTGADLGTIAVTMPYGSVNTALVPTITTNVAKTVSPVSGLAQDFTNPVEYTVTPYDPGVNPRVYTVTVTNAPCPIHEIAALTITDQLSSTINVGAATVNVVMPEVYDLTSLTPTITLAGTGASILPASGVARNFSAPVTYTVTAEDLGTEIWTVTVINYNPYIPTLRAAQYIDDYCAANGTVAFTGLDPANIANGTTRTMTFRADGTMSQYYNGNNMGWITGNGTYSYDSNNAISVHFANVGAMVIDQTYTISGSGIIADNGNTLKWDTQKLTTPFANSILGTYSITQDLQVVVPAIAMHMDVFVNGTKVVSTGGPIPWAYNYVVDQYSGRAYPLLPLPHSGGTLTHTETPTSGSLVVPTDVWLYQIGSEYFIQHDFTYDLTR